MEHENQNIAEIINRMLLEIATGNLFYRIEIDHCDDEFIEIVNLLNEIAIKLQHSKYKKIKNRNINNDIIEKGSAHDILQKVMEYILNHLEDQLPTTKELSKMFGTNEFTLKESFRNILKTTIYQFYNDGRLNKAHFLIVESQLPFNEIAFLCGFNNYTNFYKAFKKKFTYTPTYLSRNLFPPIKND